MKRSVWVLLLCGCLNSFCPAVPPRPVVCVCGGVCLRQQDGKWIAHSPQSPEDVQRLVDRAAAHGIDRLTPSLGTQYHSKFFKSEYTWNPLQVLVEKAHAAGIEVHPYQATFANGAWFDDLPGGAAKYFSVKRDGQKDSFLSPGYDCVRRRLIELYLELLVDYDVDGVIFDYVRFSTHPDTYQASGGYDPPIVAAFQSQYGVDPFTIPDNNPHWVQFRAAYITKMLQELRTEMAQRHVDKPIGVFTWVGGPKHKHFGTPQETLMATFQDNATWAAQELVDNFYTMTYSRSPAELRYQIRNLSSALHAANPDARVVGAVYATPSMLKDNLGAGIVLQNGADGVFFYRADYLETAQAWPTATSLLSLFPGK